MKIFLISIQVLIGILALLYIINLIKRVSSSKETNTNKKSYLEREIGKVTQLEPCPFCGKNTINVYRTAEGSQVVCDVSEGGCGVSTGLFDTDTEAVDAWNLRGGENKSSWGEYDFTVTKNNWE